MKKQLDTNHVEIPSFLKRVNYFYGQLLSQADFFAEQAYTIKRSRLHNLHIHGYGVVSGLDVSASKGPANALMVKPGLAIDPAGNEIILPAVVKVPFPRKGDLAHLVLYWAERETDFIPAPEGSAASRIEEYAILKFETGDSAAKTNGVLLAQLKRLRGVWKVDKKFRVRRVKK